MGTKERREKELLQRRDLILKKSRELFFEQGYENVSIQDICHAVEYGRSAIYAHFRSKEEIYAHIHLEGIKLFADWCEQSIVTSVEYPVLEFMKFPEVLCDFYEQQREYFVCMFFFNYKERIKELVGDEIYAAKMQERQRIGNRLFGVVKKGIDIGQFKPLDINEMLELYWRSLVGVVSFAVYEGRMDDFEFIREQSKRHTQIYLEGLMV